MSEEEKSDLDKRIIQCQHYKKKKKKTNKKKCKNINIIVIIKKKMTTTFSSDDLKIERVDFFHSTIFTCRVTVSFTFYVE